LTSYTHFEVQSWFLFSVTYNHISNHQRGSDLLGTPMSRHKVQVSLSIMSTLEKLVLNVLFA
jgi:hypothetical protein